MIFNTYVRGLPSFLLVDLTPIDHDHNNRNYALSIYLPGAKTNAMKRTVTYRAIVTWNKLPIHVRQADNKYDFKKMCKHDPTSTP